MHNLKTNFDKIIGIAKSMLGDVLFEDDNFFNYKNKPKMSDIEIVALALTAESLGIDSELFSKLRSEFLSDFPRLPDRSNYNRRRKRLQDYLVWISDSIAKTISPDENQFILDSIPVPICTNPRISRSKICKDDPEVMPRRSYHASHKSHYYGLRFICKDVYQNKSHGSFTIHQLPQWKTIKSSEACLGKLNRTTGFF